MKIAKIILISVLAVSACADTLPRVVLTGRVNYNIPPNPIPGYILEESFEDAGIPVGWTEVSSGGSVNWDSTLTPVPDGSEIMTAATTAGSSLGRYEITPRDDLTVFFATRRGNMTTTFRTTLRLLDASSNVLVTLQDGEPGWKLIHGSATQTNTPATSTPDDKWFYHWFSFKTGTGANGISQLMTATNTAATGTVHNVSITTGTTTGQPKFLDFGYNTGSLSDTWRFDLIKIREGTNSITAPPTVYP